MRWESARGFELTDEMVLTISAHAALPVLELGADLYRKRVDDHRPPPHDRAHRRPARTGAGTVSDEPDFLLGEAHFRGPVLLAWAAVLRQAKRPARGEDVVIHEFAHRLDMLDGLVDGTPPLGDDDARARSVAVCTAEFDRCAPGNTIRCSGAMRPPTRASSSLSSARRSSRGRASSRRRSPICTACCGRSTLRIRPPASVAPPNGSQRSSHSSYDPSADPPSPLAGGHCVSVGGRRTGFYRVVAARAVSRSIRRSAAPIAGGPLDRVGVHRDGRDARTAQGLGEFRAVRRGLATERRRDTRRRGRADDVADASSTAASLSSKSSAHRSESRSTPSISCVRSFDPIETPSTPSAA